MPDSLESFSNDNLVTVSHSQILR